jgi:ferredoxin
MFRGMSGSEYSRKFHTRLELYKRLDLPVFNPLLGFGKEEILDVIRQRYGLPLNHGFVHWRRLKAQETVGAVKRRLSQGALAYRIRDPAWIATKHLTPVSGRWLQRGNEIRFWNVEEQIADTVIKKMINCLDCGFCVVECFSGCRFDRKTKSLQINGCIHCGRCLRLKFCMGWQHRFWRRVIVTENEHAT